MNRVQFQPGLSTREFLRLYGVEEFCEAALIARPWTLGVEGEIDRALQRVTQEPEKGKKRSMAKSGQEFEGREGLFRTCGLDRTRINGIDMRTAMTIAREVGTT